MFNLKRKVLFGVSVSMVLAMAIGSFALSESQTLASPQEVEAQGAVGATVGSFTVNGGTQGTDYEFTGTPGTDGVLKIHPQSIGTNITISNTSTTTDRIEVTSAATITLAGVNISTGTGPALQIQDDATFNVNILLADGSNNILKATANNYAGLQKNGEGDNIGTLTIGVPDGSAGTGKLQATGGWSSAGIGGGYKGNGSNITIRGGVVTVNGGYDGAGIGGGREGSGSNITISGGKVIATGGFNGAGIGGGGYKSGSNIEITGGVVTATGGDWGAGIGGGYYGSGSYITISGAETKVTAIGGTNAAGIGGGGYKSGSNIEITGGEVTATGGNNAAGIGDGYNPSASGSGNSINGDAVVLATSGAESKDAFEGFVDGQGGSLLTQGITFTGLGTAFDDKGHATDFSWDEGIVHGGTTLLDDLEIPVTLTVPEDSSLTINQGVTLTVPPGMALQNEGTLTVNGTVDCLDDQAAGTTGEVTTKTDFYLEGSTDVYTTGYQTYQTSAGVQKYTNLPNPDGSNDTVFDSWFTKPGGPDGGGTKVDENTNVLLNEHSFYEHRVAVEYTITVADLENGSITPDVTEAAEDAEVVLTVTPDEGYQFKEGSLTVTDADGNEVPVTEQDGKYTFTMPGADVTVSAAFELIPEPSIDPDQGGDGSSKTGDSFAGIAALAILGLATTGAVMLRKRK